MDGTTIAAIIAGSATIIGATITLLKREPKGGVTSVMSGISDSIVASGKNISQTYSPTVNNYHAPAQTLDPFSSKVESTPTLADIINDLRNERRPYEAIQAHKAYLGLQVCWSLTFDDLWESSSEGAYTIRLAPLNDDSITVLVNVDIDHYPKLKVAERGHPAWAEGKIDYLSGSSIFLARGTQITLK